MTMTREEMEIRRNTKLPVEYDVGYGKPPTSNWFPPGVSGNPSGRPKGSKNKPPTLGDEYFTAIMRDEVYRQVPVEAENDGGNATVSAVRAVARSLVKSAISGDYRAAQWVLEKGRAIEVAAAAQLEKDFEYATAHKERWERAIKEAKDCWREIPQPIPHPDHIILDQRHRRVIFTGPRNAEEKAEYDELMAESAKVPGGVEPAVEQTKVEVPDIEAIKVETCAETAPAERKTTEDQDLHAVKTSDAGETPVAETAKVPPRPEWHGTHAAGCRTETGVSQGPAGPPSS